jgi:hypothetical protein
LYPLELLAYPISYRLIISDKNNVLGEKLDHVKQTRPAWAGFKNCNLKKNYLFLQRDFHVENNRCIICQRILTATTTNYSFIHGFLIFRINEHNLFFVCKISQSKSLKNPFIWPNSKQIKSLTIQEIILDQLIQIQNILK